METKTINLAKTVAVAKWARPFVKLGILVALPFVAAYVFVRAWNRRRKLMRHG